MLKVRVFDADDEQELEGQVNDFLETIHESALKDIQFQVAIADDADGEEWACCYSAMILYLE